MSILSVSLFKKKTFDLSIGIIFISLLIRIVCLGAHPLLAEEAYYWNYAEHLDFGYLDHPPMVAILIKLFSYLGTSEFYIRLPSVFCWAMTACFSYLLTERMKKQTGRYAVMLLSILPFYFLQSLVITPDQPLIVAWSGLLYFLYLALIEDKKWAWYGAGILLGLGLLSKYTIILMVVATLFYMLIDQKSRHHFLRKEPYLAAMLAFLIFTPVIYWNATHEWVSFLFQSKRRFDMPNLFNFHIFIGLLCLFLTPVGLYGLWKLSTEHTPHRFFQVFTLFPLFFFACFSFTHQIKFNWIGPILLSAIPWIAANIEERGRLFKSLWFSTSLFLFICYGLLLYALIAGAPPLLQQRLLPKYIAWDDLTKSFNELAVKLEQKTNNVPVFVPLDLYNISSELLYYQTQFLASHRITKMYPVVGRHVFGLESLMYKYWIKSYPLEKHPIIVVSTDPTFYQYDALKKYRISANELQIFWSHSKGNKTPLKPFYYAILNVAKTGA